MHAVPGNYDNRYPRGGESVSGCVCTRVCVHACMCVCVSTCV